MRGRWIIVLVASAIGGCAGDDAERAAPSSTTTPTVAAVTPTSTTTTTSSTLPPSRDPVGLEVILESYTIAPAGSKLTPGAYSLTARNRDGVPHDVVLIATDLAADQLPTEGIRVDEDGLDVRARTARIEPHGAGSLMATLRPGRYLLVCTVPHHYVRDQMVATLTVSA
jgi:uncharacterized cupredoxin-like copper-binding protein